MKHATSCPSGLLPHAKLLQKRNSLFHQVAQWSRGMIPALGAGGLEFESRLSPTFWQRHQNLEIYVFTSVIEGWERKAQVWVPQTFVICQRSRFYVIVFLELPNSFISFLPCCHFKASKYTSNSLLLYCFKYFCNAFFESI